ncbi:NERD domain-containing protein/DEAD/DEAH box helicase [Alphaproteobacteria bacterium]|nr:NERD domain-containing protein/DEAD/DEAH box helicase [Alphaproteobacteria bacterium]
MGTCYPSYLHNSNKNKAEELIFEVFKTNPLCSSWIIFHSLALPPGTPDQYYRYGEIDFVVLIPNLGLICIEAKSSSVKCEDGVWTIFNRKKQQFEKLMKSPIKQAQDGMFILIKNIIERTSDPILSRLIKNLCGFHAIFPESKCPVLPLEIDRVDISDRDDFKDEDQFIKRLLNNISMQLHNKKYKELKYENFSSDIIKELKKIIRPNFAFSVQSGVYLNTSERNIIKFSDDQLEIIDEFENNIRANNRIVIDGPPGTGKTFLAIEMYKRISGSKKTILLYFNRLISSVISSQLESEGYISKNCITIHSLMDLIIKKSALYDDFKLESTMAKNKQDLFENIYPRYAEASIEEEDKYECIIIDEGQDIINSKYMSLVSKLSKNKTETPIYIFSDAHHQNIFLNEQKEFSKNYFLNFYQKKLTTNYRNSEYIGKYAAAFAGLNELPYKLVNIVNQEPRHIFYESQNEFVKKLKDKVLDKLDTDTINKGVIFLSTRDFAHSILSCIDFSEYDFQLLKINDDNFNNFSSRKNTLYFSTIQSFKGLEASTVIYIDINFNDSEKNSQLHFTTITRAKALLFLMIDRKYKNNFEKILVEYNRYNA